ncbi:hypothetical protein [Limisalsivibrio acetivorans]|uniref:hypothetical protein n=1 Tax=Limisalsivibrio acetivorans TaxID=1304888 RepID=UPI0003B7574D|nr:hypothetical protein [Limisalsivibrio acetivorans]
MASYPLNVLKVNEKQAPLTAVEHDDNWGLVEDAVNDLDSRIAGIHVDEIDNFINKGTVSSGTVTFDYSEGRGQAVTIAGSVSFDFTGFVAGKAQGIVIRVENGGSSVITFPLVHWRKSDGTSTTNFSEAGVILQSVGTNFLIVWSDDGGATLHGSIL